MISAQGLIRRAERTLRLLDSDNSEKPVAFQIFGNDPSAMADAARICQDFGADIIDINMGCPVKKVLRNGAGCALLDDPDNVKRIIAAVKNAITVPLTIKMRLGMEKARQTYIEIAKIAECEGADAICLHPRTRTEFFRGDIDIDALKKLKDSVSVPVIGSGNLFSTTDVTRMLEYTGCDAVMIARGALGNPFIFEELRNPDYDGKTIVDIRHVIEEHVELFSRIVSEKVCHREMKKHMLWYTKGFPSSSSFRQKVVTTDNLVEMMSVVGEYFDAMALEQ